MNDYFLTILIRERQQQLLNDARTPPWRPARRASGRLKWKAAVAALIPSHLSFGTFAGCLAVGGRGKGR